MVSRAELERVMKKTIAEEGEKQQYVLCSRNRAMQFCERTIPVCVIAPVVGLGRKRGYISHF